MESAKKKPQKNGCPGSRGDVAVSEEILDFADIDGGGEEQGGSRRPEGMWRVDARPRFRPLRTIAFFDGARQPLEVVLNQ
jgi:hypothetical protein